MLHFPTPTLEGKLQYPKNYVSIEEAFADVRDDLSKLLEESNE